jgi:hypothetical protein
VEIGIPEWARRCGVWACSRREVQKVRAVSRVETGAAFWGGARCNYLRTECKLRRSEPARVRRCRTRECGVQRSVTAC